MWHCIWLFGKQLVYFVWHGLITHDFEGAAFAMDLCNKCCLTIVGTQQFTAKFELCRGFQFQFKAPLTELEVISRPEISLVVDGLFFICSDNNNWYEAWAKHYFAMQAGLMLIDRSSISLCERDISFFINRLEEHEFFKINFPLFPLSSRPGTCEKIQIQIPEPEAEVNLNYSPTIS